MTPEWLTAKDEIPIDDRPPGDVIEFGERRHIAERVSRSLQAGRPFCTRSA